MGMYSDIEIKLGDKVIEEFLHFSLQQSMLAHHRLHLEIRKDQIEDAGSFYEKASELIGKQIKLSHKSLHGGKNVFVGTVDQVKHKLSHDDEIIHIQAGSPDIRLSDAPHYFSFENSSLSNIVKQTLDRYNINKVRIKPGKNPRLAYVVQHNESGFDFLKRLAIRHGEWFFYDGDTLCFGPLPQKTVKLSYGKDLFHVEYSQRLESFNYRLVGHDYYRNQREAVDVFFASSKVPKMSKQAFDESGSAFGESSNHYYQGSYHGMPGYRELYSFTQLAKSSSIARMMFVKGLSDHADLSLGATLEFDESSESRGGRFILIGLEHRCNRKGNYQVEFLAVPADVPAPHYTDLELQSFAQPYSAIVKNNNDPMGMGRIRVAFFWGDKHALKTPWLRIVGPHAGKEKGMQFIPEVGEEVLVGFEGGNPERPYVTGSLYHGEAKPMPRWNSANNDIKAIRTRSGHTIEFDDKRGKEEIRIYDNEASNYNYAITLCSHSKEIAIEAKGDMEIKADNLKISVNQNIEIEAQNIKQSAKNNLQLEAMNDIDIEGSNKVSISSSNSAIIKAINKMTVDGGLSLEHKASTGMSLDGGGRLTQKAAMIKIN